MKTHISTIFVSLVVGFIGGMSAQYLWPGIRANERAASERPEAYFSPEQVQTGSTKLKLHIAHLEQKISILEARVAEISDVQPDPGFLVAEPTSAASALDQPALTSKLDNLISAGVNPGVAEDILQRISEQEYQRLQLNNLMERADQSSRQRYAEELKALGRNKIDLRSELGDDAYDHYLYASGRDNRVKVLSVMSGSPAESYGFQSEDIILFYDDQKILNWRDIRKATLQGEIGILRDGSRMNFTVPRGTLGVQLAAVQLSPQE